MDIRIDTYVFRKAVMNIIEKKICLDGKVFPGNILKVGSFLNHQLDVPFLAELGKNFYDAFKEEKITKILTIETSGIAVAFPVAQLFGVPLLFAKKSQTKNLSDECYTSEIHSFTHGNDYVARVEKQFLSDKDVVLVIDDFLANGCALEGLLDICSQAGAKVAGCGIAIEKAFQDGGKKLRKKGIRIVSLAKIKEMNPDGGITFEKSDL